MRDVIDDDEVIKTVNDLIETCKDGEEGFRNAASNVSDVSLKSLFNDIADQRRKFAGELQDCCRNLGADPEQTGSVAASMHRGWMDLKAAVTGNDDGSIISECERGEDSAVESYQEALTVSLPSEVRSVIERQFAEVKRAHDQVRELEVARNP